MQAGLTRAEARQAVRRGLDVGDLSGRGASETAAQDLDRFYVDIEVI
jgi:methyl coenzyme M reductase gamma subunit